MLEPSASKARIDLTDVLASDLSGAGGGAAGEDLEALADVDDGRARDGGRAVGEGDAVEVDEVDEGAAGAEVLDDPLGVVLAELVGLGGEGVGDGLARSGVLEGDRTGLQAARLGSHDDGVASGDGEAGEGVGIVGVPLVPGVYKRNCISQRLRKYLLLTHAWARPDG